MISVRSSEYRITALRDGTPVATAVRTLWGWHIGLRRRPLARRLCGYCLEKLHIEVDHRLVEDELDWLPVDSKDEAIAQLRLLACT